MGERNLTLFAVHLHNDGDVQIGPKTIGRGGRAETTGRSRWRKRRDALPIPLGAGAVALVAFAALAWRFLDSR